jgi:hypothetical protein
MIEFTRSLRYRSTAFGLVAFVRSAEGSMRLKLRISAPSVPVKTGQSELQAARQRFSDESLDKALKVAWDLLVAADHPATASERARHTRRFIAEAIVRAARDATDAQCLWLAGIDAFRHEAFPQRAHVA